MTGYSRIEYVRYGILTDKDNDKLGVVTINKSDTFNNVDPVSRGIYDPFMGTTDYHYNCKTCLNNKRKCYGHPGKLLLNYPLIQPIAREKIIKWLKIVCLECSSLIVESTVKGKSLNILAGMNLEKKHCLNEQCKVHHPKIEKLKDDPIGIYVTKNNETTKMFPHDIYDILSKVTPEAVHKIGEQMHPTYYMLSKNGYMRVLDVSIRPSIKLVGTYNSTQHNEINGIIQNIIKLNDKLKNSVDMKTAWEFQEKLHDMILGTTGTNMFNTNKPSPAIARRLPRKTGRARQDLLGCVIRNVARSTISGNMRLKINQLGFPITFAQKAKKIEYVQAHNYDLCRKYFLNGKLGKYPGCSIIYHNNSKFYVENYDRDIEIGDRIERDLIDGDWVLFNRQPSLEKSSIGGHQIVINHDPNARTFQLNVDACSNYNADFDGDEMNVYIPMSIASSSEVAMMSSVNNFLISTKTSGPINGCNQDTILGLQELTRSGVEMDRAHAMYLFRYIDEDFEWSDKEFYTGKDMISKLLEKTPINYQGKPTFYNPIFAPYVNYHQDDIKVSIKNGVLETGVLDKKSVGASAINGIFHNICMENGPKKTIDTIYNFQQIGLEFLMQKGFTVGVGDMILPVDKRKMIGELISQVSTECETVNENLLNCAIEAPITHSVKQWTDEITKNTVKFSDEKMLRPILEGTSFDTNGFLKMISCGSKGKIQNTMAIMGSIGQMLVNGERPEESFSYARRSCVYSRYDYDPKSAGFVENCFINGVNMIEFLFSMQSGRFDLITKALSTADTGYFLRKLIMALQSVVINVLRSSVKDNQIVQLLYGDNGLDTTRVEHVHFWILKCSDKDFKEKCYVEGFEKEFKNLQECRNFLRGEMFKIEQNQFDNIKFNDTFLIAANTKRIMDFVINGRKSTNSDSTNPKNLREKANMVNKFVDDLGYIYLNRTQKERKAPIPVQFQYAVKIQQINILQVLNPKQLQHISVSELKKILDMIEWKYAYSLIDYGQVPGILASNAVGEPMIQYMLDSHHRSVGDSTSNQGIQKINEIYGDNKNEINPTMYIPLLPEIRSSFKKVQEIANNLEIITLARFIMQSDEEILYETYKESSFPVYFKKDLKWMEDFRKSHPTSKPPADLSYWCVRFQISKLHLVLKNVSVETIVRVLQEKYNNKLYIVHTSENVKNIVLRCYVRLSYFPKTFAGNERDKVIDLRQQLYNTKIRGVEKIQSASVEKDTLRNIVLPDGSIDVDTSERYYIKTKGSNLFGVMMIEGVDAKNILSSSIRDTCEVFGLEAGRAKIINETIRFMGGNAPNLSHLQVIADEMTRIGRITSIEKSGINKREPKNIQLRAAASSPVQVNIEAALNNVTSKLYGVDSFLVNGAIPKIGTLYSDVCINEDFLQSHHHVDKLDDIFDELDF